MNTPIERQRIGCGYEPPLVDAVPWSHPGYIGPIVDDVEQRPTTCPGYTCKLPDVVEVSRVRALAKLGGLESACGGHATDMMLDAILVLEGEAGAMESWTMTPASKGGGRAD